MLVATATFVRENTQVPWHVLSDVFKNHMSDAYFNTGKLVTVSSVLSQDGLTLDQVNYWVSRPFFDEFLLDQEYIEMKEERLLYCINNNILIDYLGKLFSDRFLNDNDMMVNTPALLSILKSQGGQSMPFIDGE